MEGEEKDRNWDERRGRKRNSGKVMGEDVMTRSVRTQIHGISGEKRDLEEERVKRH
jgi:hypothetical protein